MYLYVYQNSLECRISYSRGKKDGGSLRQEEIENKRDVFAVECASHPMYGNRRDVKVPEGRR